MSLLGCDWNAMKKVGRKKKLDHERLDDTMSFAVTEEEANDLHRQARLSRLSTSAFLRRRVGLKDNSLKNNTGPTVTSSSLPRS
jgi:hypothetical protein